MQAFILNNNHVIDYVHTDPSLELRRDLPRVVAQAVEAHLQLGAMGYEVARRLLAEHDPLRCAQTSHAERETTQPISASTATAPAPIAMIPWVSVSVVAIRTSYAIFARELDPCRPPARLLGLGLLFEDGQIARLVVGEVRLPRDRRDLRGHPRGAASGTSLTVISAPTVLPGIVSPIVREALICLPATSTPTETLTLVSGLSPEFSTIATNVGLAPLLTWLSVGEVERVVDPTLTPVRALPWVPGASAPFDEAGDVRSGASSASPD